MLPLSPFDFLFPSEFPFSELRNLRTMSVILDEGTLRAQGLAFIDRIVAAAEYDDVPLLHRAVHTLKYKRVRGLAEILGGMLVDVTPLPEGEEDLLLCPVPLHWIRRFSRGFNQAELLGKVVSRNRRWKMVHLLKRVRWTGSQVGRHRVERLKGVEDAFRVRRNVGIPEHVVLIDDLSTTGATLNMCAKALKAAGVSRVEGLVLALG